MLMWFEISHSGSNKTHTHTLHTQSTTASVSGVQSPAHGAGGDGGGVRSEDVMKGEEEDERERLTSELQEIERERSVKFYNTHFLMSAIYIQYTS